MNYTVLSTALGSLVIGSGEYCPVYLEAGTNRTMLGSDLRALIVSRLRAGLEAKTVHGCDGEMNGLPVAWMLSLSEPNSSLYVGDLGDSRHIFAESENSELIVELVLDNEDRKRWLRELL